MTKGLKQSPNYSVMPIGFDWNEFRRLTSERITTNRMHQTEILQQIHPHLGVIDSKTRTLRGNVAAKKTRQFIQSSETSELGFHVIHYVDWRLGRCFIPNSGKDFVFPLDINLLKSLTLRNINRVQTAMYESWAECFTGIVKLFTMATPREKQFSLERWIEKCAGNKEEALHFVVQKTILEFDPEDLVATPRNMNLRDKGGVHKVQPKKPF